MAEQVQQSPVDHPGPRQEALNIETVTKFYRNLPPNIDMNQVPLREHVDAIAVGILDTLGKEIPESVSARFDAIVAETTDLHGLSRKLALAGSEVLPIFDLILDLSERSNTGRDPVIDPLLDCANSALIGMRENPALSVGDRLDASAKRSNIRLEILRRNQLQKPSSEYSDTYIQVVRAEAKWFSKQAMESGVKSGDLFEIYIGCLARYQAWASEKDDKLFVRHATIREDKPNRRRDGGSGHRFAHDVHIFGAKDKAMIQCKWGSAAMEEKHKYDEEKVIFIPETTDDGTLARNKLFQESFSALAYSDKPTNADLCDTMAKRYGLDRIIRDLEPETTVHFAGSIATGGSVVQ